MSEKRRIVIVDYGLCNLHSIKNVLINYKIDFVIDIDGSYITEATHILLPGVGAFKKGMELLTARNQSSAIQKAANKNVPILGICLGAQMLMTQSEEFEITKGLNLIEGNVVEIPKIKGFPIPNVGWRKIEPQNVTQWRNSIFSECKRDEWMYFVHSFQIVPINSENILAYTWYGKQRITAAIVKENCYGVQFHPEKSGEQGLSILKKFLLL